MRFDDRYLIHKCLNGDREAFSLLVDKYKASIFALAYSKLRNFHNAEDVTQEAFVKAYQKLATLRWWDDFPSWLYAITFNLCKNWMRSEANRPDREFIADQDPGVLDKLSTNPPKADPEYEPLHEALKSLPEIYRQVLTLHYFAGMSIEEIARFLRTNSNTIAQRLKRGREKLGKEMVAMMGTLHEKKSLQADFTFRVVEIVKRIGKNPFSGTSGVPLCLSVAMGVIIAILSLSSLVNVPNPLDNFTYSPDSRETPVIETDEIPVDVLKISRQSATSGNMGLSDSSNSTFPNTENAILPAPDAKAGEFPEGPLARLGKGSINAISYSPNGKLLAAAGSLGVWIYNADNLDEMVLLKGHGWAGAISVTFSPDGELIASGGDDDKIFLWDVKEQKQLAVMKKASSVYSVVFSPDGKLLASGSWDNSVRLWNVDSQELLAMLKGHTGPVRSVAFSPDGRLLVSGSDDNTVRLWDVDKQEELDVLKGHTAPVSYVAFSPDGKLLASSGSQNNRDNTVRLWNVQEGKQVGVLQHGGIIYCLAFSPDGKLLASGDYWTLNLWDVAEQKQLATLDLDGNTDGVKSLSFSPDGKSLASSSSCTVRIWNVEERIQIGLLEGVHTDCVWSVAFSPDCQLFASCGEDRRIRLWDIHKKTQTGLLQGHTRRINSLAFSPDEETLASGSSDGTIGLWNVQKQNQSAVIRASGEILSLIFNRDGTILASGGSDYTVRLWDIQSKSQTGVLRGHTSWVYCVAFSQDGKLLASGEGWPDNTIRIWDVQEQKQVGLLKGHTNNLASLAFSPDGKLLASGSWDKTVCLWDVQGQKQKELLQGHTSPVSSVAFSPDGKLLVSSSWAWGGETSIIIWDVEAGKRVSSLVGHPTPVNSMALSKDGKWLVSGGSDGTVLLWEMNLPPPVQGEAVETTGKLPDTWGGVKRTALLQNFPNPFNPETWIPFSLSESENVRINIHSSTGQLIKILHLGTKEGGNYLSKEKAAYWDGKNEAGEGVASGVYFYTIEAGDFRDSRKMVISQ